MPAQAHQLVKAVPRDGESQPHEEIDIQAHFENKPEAAVNSGIKRFCHGQNHGRDQNQTQDKTHSGNSKHENLLDARWLLWHSLDAVDTDHYHQKKWNEV